MKTRHQDVVSYVTRDGSTIRELMHPEGRYSGQPLVCEKQSLAEAIVSPGMTTKLHRHHVSEELYHITAGQGLMTLSEDTFEVSVGDTVCIPPSVPHCIKNTGNIELKILCCCSPAYRHDDTELLD